MKKYYVTYNDKEHDLCTIWVRANNLNEAEWTARDEYWDIDEILSITEG